MQNIRYAARKSVHFPPKFIFIVAAAILLLVLLVRLLSSIGQQDAFEAVNAFYKHEQASNFAQSWELFHPYMKAKFSKNQYIQERNHIFMQHFGVTTFDFTIGKPQKQTDWSISRPPELPLLDSVIQFTVTKHYKSKFGTFEIVQPVIAAQEEGEWVILWSYQ